MKQWIGALCLMIMATQSLSVANAADRGRNMDVLSINPTRLEPAYVRFLQDNIFTQPLHLFIDSRLIAYDDIRPLVKPSPKTPFTGPYRSQEPKSSQANRR
ncbi:hypothetical protein [Alteromonas sp. C1M14]|uniref:hypothetical protein n=1 Tax=Alteromonas sp. C1M14 TaxID=2841567 RepID=UPI001C096405|nr:hypothetical protein [Alteromonas sp. C1M14]MBU2979114.1 hypothetical protein [Alteromonas sp. C1M14]